MPKDDPDPSDPHVLVGVSLPASPEATTEMARAFAEEFAAMGWDEARLLGLFKRPFYAGPHQAYRLLGEETTLSIIREAVQVWGRYRVAVSDKNDRDDSEDLVQIALSPVAVETGPEE